MRSPSGPFRDRSGAKNAALADMVPHLERGFAWLYSDNSRDSLLLLTLSEALLQKDPDLCVLLSLPQAALLNIPPLERRILLSTEEQTPLHARQMLAQGLHPAALLMAVQTLPVALIRYLGRHHIPIFAIEAQGPVFDTRWQYLPGFRRSVLSQITRVFVPAPDAQAAWLARGLRADALTVCGRLASTPTALGCNEAEREALAGALRLRPVWLAAGVPEREEAVILQAQREALRESHRLALILHPMDRMRGTALKAMFGAQFQTALRSEDELLTPDTQVYIVDTEAERGLWYRLAVACYLGGSLTNDGATLSPLEPAGMGSAIVHGRYFGRHADAFDLLRSARATRMIQSAGALGAAICTALRPEQAADQAHRGWQVISEGYEATETVLEAVLQAVARARQA